MQGPPPKAFSVGVFFILGASTAVVWAVYHLLLSLSPERNRLTEFDSQLMALLINYMTGAVFLWIEKRALFPGTPGQHALRIGPGISSSLAAALLCVAWVAVWAYVTILRNSFRAALFDSSKLGVSLQEKDALRILAELIGLLSFGVLFPLLAASAFVIGLACSSSLRILTLLIPAGTFCTITAVWNYGRDVMATGRPPIYDVMQVVFGGPERPLTPSDLGLMWILNIMLFFVGCWVFAAYGRVWTALGFLFRRWFLKREE
jgi:hypothetical protein